MKFYVHFEEALTPITFVFEVTADKTTIADIVQVFIKVLKTKITLKNYSGHKITKYKRKQPLPECAIVSNVVTPGEDLYLVFEDELKLPALSHQVQPALGKQKVAEPVKSKSQNKSSLTKSQVLKYGLELEDLHQCHKSVLLYTQWLHSGNSNADVWNRLVSIYMRAARFDKGLHYAGDGLKAHPTCQSLQLSYAECLIDKNPKKALEVIMNYTKDLRSSGTGSTSMKHNLQMLMCRAYQKLDMTDMAIVMVEGVLRDDQGHQQALLEFAKLTFDLGEEPAIQSIAILLSALVKNKDSKTVRQYLTEACRKPRGMQYLQKVTCDAWSDIPALVLLSNVLRDNGALELSLGLLDRAIHLNPTDPDALLCYIHLLEITNQPDEAIQRVKLFCHSDVTSPVFLSTSQHMDALLQKIPDKMYLYSDIDSKTITQLSEPSAAYTRDDLSILAIWFTVIKILFVQGALSILPELCQLLEPFHKSKDLHTTDIRNEAAYFKCISQLVNEWSKIPLLHGQLEFVYIIGDSHCIPPSWQTMVYKNPSMVLHPILSTGTKIWHLRPDSVFYPKANFHNAISLIPDGATVIIALGEIDCREALLQSVEKCHYDTIDDAIDQLLDIYISVLREMQENHRWKIYVHPVPPVLAVTRNIVTNFNHHLEMAITRLSCSDIVYMNGVAEGVMTEDGANLKEKYCFDDTHLHPAYVKLLEQFLAS